MFPTFVLPPQHAETVGARKARQAKEEEATRRSSSATSLSSGSVRSAAASSVTASTRRQATNSSQGKSGLGWFGKKKGVKEISSLPSIQKTNNREERDVDIDEGPGPAPPTASLPNPPHHSYADQDTRSRPSTSHRPNFTDRFPPPPLSLGSPPSLPPSGALPLPPSPPSPGPLIPDRKSHYSTVTTSSHPTTVSSSRTNFSNRSVFSAPSQYEEPLAEDDFVESPYGSNVQFEAIERGSRIGSRQSDHVSKTAQGPFARALAKMESASARIISTRLGEEWEGLEDDESYQEVIFEKRLWALVAYQRLTQNKQLQSPAHEMLGNSRPADQRRVLNLHGSIADGWVLATKYPAATVYTLSSKKSSTLPTAYPAPLNHHSLYVPSISSASPFPDGYFDAIVARSVATVFRNDQWVHSLFDCMRVLKPGGQLEVLTIDAHLSCEGPKLAAWVEEHLTCRLEGHGLSKQASDTVLDTMEIVGLESIRRARIALPAHSPKTALRPAPPPSHSYGAQMPAPSPQDTTEASRMMAFLGRHFYQDLHSNFIHSSQGEEWFWAHKNIQVECERYKTKMVLMIACALKPSSSPNGESYLNL